MHTHTHTHTYLRLQVLNINAFLENFLYLFDRVSHAVLTQKGVEYFHCFRVTSTIQLFLLLCEVKEKMFEECGEKRKNEREGRREEEKMAMGEGGKEREERERKGSEGKEREGKRVREKREREEGGKEYRIKKYLALVVCHMGVPAEEP